MDLSTPFSLLLVCNLFHIFLVKQFFHICIFYYCTGLVAGVFSSTRCGIQRYRKQNDWVNALIAGAVTGAAIAAGTRRWTQVIGVAGIVSAFSAAADYSRTN